MPGTSSAKTRFALLPGHDGGVDVLRRRQKSVRLLVAFFLFEKSLRLQRQMHPVLERRILLRRQQSGIVGDRHAQRLHPGAVAFREIRQHVTVHQFLDAGMTDAEPHPAILVADMRTDRAQAVMAGDAAADLDAHLRRRQFDLIVEHSDLAGRELEEIGGFLHGAAGIVHEGRGLEQHDALAFERAFRGLALKAAAPWCEIMMPRDLVDGHEPDVVPVLRVFHAGITEADKEAHDAASSAVSAYFFLSPPPAGAFAPAAGAAGAAAAPAAGAAGAAPGAAGAAAGAAPGAGTAAAPAAAAAAAAAFCSSA